jgi:hypothetical protein
MVEEQKDGSPAPRARRGAVESSKPIRTDDCEEEAPALGVGRRGASRSAQPAPALAEPASKVAEEQKAQRIPCSRHVKAKSTEPMKLNDEEDKKQLLCQRRKTCQHWVLVIAVLTDVFDVLLL